MDNNGEYVNKINILNETNIKLKNDTKITVLLLQSAVYRVVFKCYRVNQRSS